MRVSQDRVAQLDSALDFESNGCGFESRHGCKSEAIAQLAARRIPDPKVGGSNPSSFMRTVYTAAWPSGQGVRFEI